MFSFRLVIVRLWLRFFGPSLRATVTADAVSSTSSTISSGQGSTLGSQVNSSLMASSTHQFGPTINSSLNARQGYSIIGAVIEFVRRWF